MYLLDRYSGISIEGYIWVSVGDHSLLDAQVLGVYRFTDTLDLYPIVILRLLWWSGLGTFPADRTRVCHRKDFPRVANLARI